MDLCLPCCASSLALSQAWSSWYGEGCIQRGQPVTQLRFGDGWNPKHVWISLNWFQSWVLPYLYHEFLPFILPISHWDGFSSSPPVPCLHCQMSAQNVAPKCWGPWNLSPIFTQFSFPSQFPNYCNNHFMPGSVCPSHQCTEQQAGPFRKVPASCCNGHGFSSAWGP